MKQTQYKFLKWVFPAILMVTSSWVNAQVDVTSTHLTNAAFDSSPNFLFDATAGNLGSGNGGANIQTVSGWTRGAIGDNSAASSFEYGYAGTLNSPGSIPATGPNGESGSGNAALGISVAWTGLVTYYQSVILPAGSYSISYDYYNSGPSANDIGKTGWVPDAGSEVLSTLTSFAQNSWLTDEITFLLTDETVGKIQIGLQATNSGSGGHGRVFFDNVTIIYTAPTQSLDATLSDLTTSTGVLSPAFESATTEYYLKVPSATASVDLTATKNDVNAAVTGDGTISLSGDQKVVDVEVTAEAGNKKTYRINIWYEDDYLFNSSFDLLPNYDLNATANLGPAANGTANMALHGWNLERNEYSTSGTYEYGTAATMNGKSVPATASDGITTGSGHAALGIMASWSAYIKYSQNVTLPAGSYKLSYKAYNANAAGAVGNSLSGWLPDGDPAVMSTIVSGGFTSETWVSDEILFSLTTETSGKIQIGMEAGAHNGPDDKAHVFIDDLELTMLAQSADANLSALTVDAGNLIPTFDPAITEYFVFAPALTTSVNVSATPNDENAQGVTGIGAIDVNSGIGSTTVQVTSEVGSTNDYTVKIFVNDAANLIDWWDGNGGVSTISGTAPNDYGWENTAGDTPWNDYNGSGGSRLRDLSGYTYEDGGATVTGVQLLLRYDGTTASETSAFTYPVILEANSVYEFTFDYVFGGSGTAPANLTAGVGTSNDVNSDVASKTFATASSTSLYRTGSLVFMSGVAGTYYVKFTCDERSWQGISNLSLTTSDVIVWNGAWSNTTGPTASDDVLIDAVLDVTGDMAVNNIEVSSNGSVIVLSGASLAIMGSATGNATIMRNTTGSGGYSIVGAPVSGDDLSSLAADYLYDWDEVNGGWSANLKSATDVMAPGKGYFVGYDGSSPSVSLTGALVSGNQSVAVTTGGTDTGVGTGWNVVANPYAAAISSDAIITNINNALSTDGNLYLWQDGGANNGAYRAGSYVVANNGASMDIGSVQGFFVNSTTGGTVDFTPDMQVTTTGANADGNYYRKATLEVQKVKLALTGNGLYNEIVVSFDANATLGQDYGWDAKFLKGNEFMSFYTLLEGSKFATQGLPVVGASPIEVALGMDLKEAGEYKVLVDQFEGFTDELSVTLIDVLTGISYELGPKIEISFSTDAVVNANRFKMIVAPSKVLSITDLAGKLQVIGGDSELTINYTSNKAEMVNIFSLDGRVVFSQEVNFNNNQAVIKNMISRNQVYVLRVNDQAIKFVLK